jgi:cysteine desulfurase
MFERFLRRKVGRIYMDHASATPPLKEAISAMRDAEDLAGNPGAIHREGVDAKKALEDARSGIAAELACKSREVIFTSGLTESNDLAILGVARALEYADRIQGSHWVVSAIEHDAVLGSFAEIERLGGEITHVKPNESGIITADAVAKVVRKDTVMISVGWANNEIGVIQPLRDISRVVRAMHENILIHSDAGQAPLYIAPHVHTVDVDLLSLGSNKLYGPHGVGALYISNRVNMKSILQGGKQERSLRPGTENVALAVGMAAALKKISSERESEKRRLKKLRDILAHNFEKNIPGLVINGEIERILPHMLNISIPGIKSEYITLALDRDGVAISTKSACREGEESRSHVIAAMSDENWRAENTLRFSLGRETNQKEVTQVSEVLSKIVKKHSSSPFPVKNLLH